MVSMPDTSFALKYLVCISCRSGSLELCQSGSEIICGSCGAVYKVVNGVPCFVPDELLNFSEVAPEERGKFLQMKRIAYSGDSLIGRMYNHYHRYAAAKRRESSPGAFTIDIGCGTGEHAPFISGKEITAGAFIGVDIDRFKLEHFRAGHPEIPLLQATVFNLPFADNSAELVQLLATLEHFSSGDISGLLDEVLRILKPGGRLTACYPAEGGIMLKTCQKLMHLFLKVRTGFDLNKETVHQHLSSAREIRGILGNRTDLKRVETRYYPFAIPVINLSLFVNEQYLKVEKG